MNEYVIVVGMNKDGPGFYAMFANSASIIGGCDTPEEAATAIIKENCPLIWKEARQKGLAKDENKKD